MYCRKCGNKLNEESKFCGKCGTPVNVENIPQPNITPVPPKPNKTALIIVICYAIFLVIIFVVSFLIGFFSYTDEDYDYETTSTAVGIKTLENKDISFQYESSLWQENESEEPNVKVVAKYESAIAIGVSSSNYLYTTNKFAEETKDYFVSQGAKILEDLEEIEINGQKWQKLVYKRDGYIIFELFLSNNYDNYSFVYSAINMNIYNKEKSDLEKVYKTLKLDTTQQAESEINAKNELLGEWDWGNSGYFVIEDEKIYLYKDSTKSSDNVFIGTYKANDKIPTKAEGYSKGIYVLVTVDEYYQDGQKIELSSNQMEFTFTQNEDGTYIIDNLKSYNTGIARKVK